MEEKKRIRPEKAKEWDKTYNEKTIAFSIGYRNKEEIMEGKRLKSYLEQSGQSANAYLKSLVKADLDNKGIEYPNMDID